MTGLRKEPVSPALGVEVDMNLDRELNDETLAELHALYDEHHLLLFRDQDLSAETQVRFSKSFGPISQRNPTMKGKETVNVSNKDPDGVLGTGELLFHSDNTFYRTPLKAIGLYGVEIPPTGGDTLFSNCEKVYESLPEHLRRTLDGLTSYQVFDFTSSDFNKRLTLDKAPPEAQRAIHPLVWENPATGRRALFFSEHTTAKINELNDNEEEALFATLRAAISDPRFTYRHKWKQGDFVFWDNVVLQHARTDFDSSQTRTLRRTPILEPEDSGRFPHSRDMSLKAA